VPGGADPIIQEHSDAPLARAAVRDERGQGLVEYALIIAIVSLGAVVSLGFLSGKINALFSKAGNSLNTAAVAAGTGNSGSSGSGGSVIDTTAPTQAIGFPADGATGVSMNPTYTGTCGTAARDLPTITLNVVRVAGNPDSGSPYGPFTTSCSGGTWSFAQPGPGASQGLKNGRTYQLTASQSDSSGNTASDTNQFTT
jgi:Flp pilus assembly pilin Flp